MLFAQSLELPVHRPGSGNVVGNTGGDYNADGTNYDVPNAPAFGRHLTGKKKKDYLNGLFAASAFPSPLSVWKAISVEIRMTSPVAGPDLKAINTFADPKRVVPQILESPKVGSRMSLKLPARPYPVMSLAV